MMIHDLEYQPQPIDAQLAERGAAGPNAAANADPAVGDRQPKGDHNRRLALGMDVDTFSLAAGITADELREYEQTWPDLEFDLAIAAKVGAALERLEADPPPSQKVSNGPVD
jgi:hypothetical protein